jgi:hypothetical protein
MMIHDGSIERGSREGPEPCLCGISLRGGGLHARGLRAQVKEIRETAHRATACHYRGHTLKKELLD